MPERAALRQAVLAEIREAASCASGDDERCEKCNRHVDAVLAAIARRRPQDGDCPAEDVFAHRPCTLKRGHEGYHDFAGQVAASETPAPGPPAMTPAVVRPYPGGTIVIAVREGLSDESVASAVAALTAATEGEGVTVVTVRGVEALRTWEPQPAPGALLRSDAETAAMLRADLADAEAQLARWPRCPAGCPCRVGIEDDADRNECGCDGPCNGGEQPARGLAAYEADIASLTDQRNRVSDTADQFRAQAARYRDLLDEIGTLAANAPEDGDSFAVLEQIAMMVAAVDVQDSAPEAAAHVPEATEQRAVIDKIWHMCQNPRQAAGVTQGVVVNGDRLAARIAGLIKNSGMEPF